MNKSEQIGVYDAINKVTADLAKEGIAKDRKNDQQGYHFRGIDDVYNAIAPILSKHGLVIIPRFLSRICEERQTQRGGTLFSVTVEAEFDFVATSDGSKHTARTFGEAMDSGDKATNKAMSAAYKYAAFQTFAIPVDGDNDAEKTSHTQIKSKNEMGKRILNTVVSYEGKPYKTGGLTEAQMKEIGDVKKVVKEVDFSGTIDKFCAKCGVEKWRHLTEAEGNELIRELYAIDSLDANADLPEDLK